jgi:hypothetical protein
MLLNPSRGRVGCRARRAVALDAVDAFHLTGEDAAFAVDHGADAIVVSNHGGRNEDTLRATIDCLPEVVAAVRRRVPVLVDGGIRTAGRRSSDRYSEPRAQGDHAAGRHADAGQHHAAATGTGVIA